MDRFRIKIWNNNQGNGVVYDNMMGAADGANPTTAFGGGSIVIHTSGQPLLASGRTSIGSGTGLLTQESLNQAVDNAINYWSNMGVDSSAVSNSHKLGLEHSQEASNIMAPTLDVGERKMDDSLSQPLAFFNTSLVLSGSLQFDGTSRSVLGNLRLSKEDVEENQGSYGHDCLSSNGCA